MSQNIKKKVKKQKNLSYLQKDFDSFRSELVLYARQHYPDKIYDFSESSLAGLFVDLAAYVGDTMSYYLDHQFNELFLDTAIENDNIERLIRLNGIDIRGPSPSSCEVRIEMTVPATLLKGEYVPEPSYLPKVKTRSILSANNGTEFELLEDVDFAKKNNAGTYIYKIEDSFVNADGTIDSFIISRIGVCSSSKSIVESFQIDNNYVPFRTITLQNEDVSEIISIIDSDGDEYYQVDSLTQDTVYKRYNNSRLDSDLVQDRIKIIPAPRRYVAKRSSSTGQTTIRFGSGQEDVFDEDIIPDPSLHAIQLYGDRKTFSTITIDPNNFLKTSTLGVSPRDTTLNVNYRYGGSLADNVSAGEISNVKILRTTFNESVPFNIAGDIRDSVTVENNRPSVGGEDEPTLQELKLAAVLGKNSQGRIVTREDLIARTYTMPANLGRVYRAAVRDNPNNPFAAQLFIISRDIDSELILSPDTLKENLMLYLSSYRLISDSIDIVDASIVNYNVAYIITVKAGYRNDQVVQSVNLKLKNFLKIENFQIDQPIIVGEIENIILNTLGVQSILSLKLSNMTGVVNDSLYSNFKFSLQRNVDRGMIFPPRGGIFELKFPNENIKGTVG
jgi:hypothetical protein